MPAECRSACGEQFLNRLRGRPVDPRIIAHCEGDAGSKNWPWVWAAAMASARRFGELAAKFAGEGFYATEFGSELYWPDVIAAQVEGLRQMTAAGERATAEALGRILRATFAYLAITAVPGPRTHTLLRIVGDDSTSNGDAHRYSGGVSIATPGHRFHPSVVAQSVLGPITAWALGYAPRLGLKITEDTSANFWPLAALQLSLGTPFGRPTPAAAWGLADEDREQLRRLVDGNDLGALGHAVGLLRGFPLVADLYVEVWGTAEGRTARLDNAVSGLKPQIAAASIDRQGRYTAYVPAAWSRLQAARAKSEDLGDRYRVFTPQASFDVPKIGGALLFRFLWDGRAGARWDTAGQGDGTTPVSPQPSPPPRPQPEPPPPLEPLQPAPLEPRPQPQPQPAPIEPRPQPQPAPIEPQLAPPTPLEPLEPGAPQPAPPAPSPSPAPEPADPAELNAIADEVARLVLARDQRGLQRAIVNELRTGGRRPPAEIADDVASFGIGEGQAQAPLWRQIVERLRAL